MKTGNTALADTDPTILSVASMEPGHEDREYVMRASGSSARR